MSDSKDTAPGTTDLARFFRVGVPCSVADQRGVCVELRPKVVTDDIVVATVPDGSVFPGAPLHRPALPRQLRQGADPRGRGGRGDAARPHGRARPRGGGDRSRRRATRGAHRVRLARHRDAARDHRLLARLAAWPDAGVRGVARRRRVPERPALRPRRPRRPDVRGRRRRPHPLPRARCSAPSVPSTVARGSRRSSRRSGSSTSSASTASSRAAACSTRRAHRAGRRRVRARAARRRPRPARAAPHRRPRQLVRSAHPGAAQSTARPCGGALVRSPPWT